MEEKHKLVEAESVKKFAFFGVAVSTVATLTAIVAVPMLCMYMQNVQSSLQDDINFCRTRAESLRGEYTKVRTHKQITENVHLVKKSIHDTKISKTINVRDKDRMQKHAQCTNHK